jgi:GxxExxY protein
MRPSPDQLTDTVINCAIRIHQHLGPGLLESSYRVLLEEMLIREGVRVARELPIDLTFDGIVVPRAYRIDLLVDLQLVVEVKHAERPHPVHRQQLLTYLRLRDLPHGLLLNFGLGTMKEGIARVSNPRAREDRGGE